MATKENSAQPTDGGRKDGSLEALEKFLGLFEQIPKKLTEGLLRQATDADEKQVVEALGATLEEQVRELSSFVRESSASLSAQGREEVMRVMRVSAGGRLAEAGVAVASNLASPVARIGISNIFHLIKKIISALAEIFGFSLPRWFWPLMELIDEIVDMLLSAGMLRIAPTLAQNHQATLGQLAQLARLQRESSWRFATTENGEE